MSPRLGTSQQFAALRQFLVESGYTVPAICERLEIPSLSTVVHLRTGGPQADTLDWLIRLFLLEEALLAASRYAVQAFAFDVSERCRAFTEFIRRLNGIGNLTVKRGDLYAPAGNQTFDRILAHPPYVPALRTTQLFRDGGEDGEWLTRRVVEGLPNYLHPGGRLYLVAMLAEYPDDSIAHRIRRFRYTNVIVERHREPATPLTVVREAGEGFTIADAERALPMVRRLDDTEWLMEQRPKAPAGVGCATESELREGRWIEQNRAFSVQGPFRVQAEVPDWAPEFLARCDGSKTVAELGRVDFVRGFLAAGILEVE